jgi:hypothetical protein
LRLLLRTTLVALSLLGTARAATLGAQRTLVMMVSFQDQPASQPFTADQVSQAVFGTTDSFVRENSYGQAWLAGSTFGWVAIPIASTTCDTLGIAREAKSAATAAGVDLAAYAHLVFLFPRTAACSFDGTSTFGGSPSQTWLNGKIDLATVGHEMGHAFGLEHSMSLSCDATGACQDLEYGDGVDIMGWSPAGHYNAYQKERLGWLTAEEVTASRTYQLGAIESAGTEPRALKILKSVDPQTGWKTWYYLELRQAIGFDTILTSPSSMMDGNNILDGLIVHQAPDEVHDTSLLLDMTPATYDLYARDPALPVGSTFTDDAAGVTIAPQWISGDVMSVQITLAKSCTRSAPAVTLAPSKGTYTLTVANLDAPGCGPSTFDLAATVPTGWTGSLGAASLSIAPNASARTTLVVTPPRTATAGTYTVGASAVNHDATTYRGSATATYQVAKKKR